MVSWRKSIGEKNLLFIFTRTFYHLLPLSPSDFFVDTDLDYSTIKKILLNVNQLPLSGVISILLSLII